MEKFTLSQYLADCNKDPMKKSTYQKRYQAIRKRITCKWYVVQSTKKVVIAMKIPSEKTSNYDYDVILEFEQSSPNDTARKLKSSEICVFSNCPSFVFLNAHYFREKGWLIEWAQSLYDPKVFDEKEKDDETRGAKKSDEKTGVVLEKSLYYAALYLNSLTAIDILTEMRRAIPAFSTKQILISVKDSQKALDRRIGKVKVDKAVTKATKTIKKQLGIFSTPSVKSTSSSSGSKSIKKIKHI